MTGPFLFTGDSVILVPRVKPGRFQYRVQVNWSSYARRLTLARQWTTHVSVVLGEHECFVRRVDLSDEL